ncbi:hypothetical protein ACJRO7_032870 [Eucalyptus globulus]|uniref:Uncharacterized protein n=1 Tax=Eucalyptus globulus TaxID=34317 RepID=A0ABD3JMB2_EUCGL
MDRMRPLYVRQQSNPRTPGGLVSPTRLPLHRSPLHRHAQSGSTGYMKKAQTKAAAQRLAQVMAHQLGDDKDDEDNDLSYEYTPASGAGSIGLTGGRAPRRRLRWYSLRWTIYVDRNSIFVVVFQLYERSS